MRERITVLIASVLVLSFTCVSSAVMVSTVSLTSGGSDNVTVSPNTSITVDLKLDAATDGIDYINFDASGGASIDGVGAWAGFNSVGSNGTLSGNSINQAWAMNSSDIPADTVLYSFDVTVTGDGNIVPEVQNPGIFGPINYSPENLIMSGLTVSIPEPATVLLLGTAGLILRKRKN